MKYTGLLFLVLPLLLPAQNDPGWVLKREVDGVRVFYRDAPDSKIKELRFETTLQATLSSIAALLSDVEGYDKWVYKNERAHLVERRSDWEMIYYEEMDFPWPLSNRDLVVLSRMWQDSLTHALHSHSVSAHHLLPEREGIVRITELEFRWTFTPQNDGTVAVDYYLKSDPGGHIPAWLINLALDQGPLRTMERFKAMLQHPRYRYARLPYIAESTSMNETQGDN